MNNIVFGGYGIHCEYGNTVLEETMLHTCGGSVA